MLMLYFINLSIDVQYDSSLAYSPNFNKQETLIEYVVEKVLKYDNAIPEVDDEDIDKRKPIKVEISLYTTKDLLIRIPLPPFSPWKEKITAYIHLNSESMEYKIPTPPPEFVTA